MLRVFVKTKIKLKYYGCIQTATVVMIDWTTDSPKELTSLEINKLHLYDSLRVIQMDFEPAGWEVYLEKEEDCAINYCNMNWHHQLTNNWPIRDI